MSGVAPVFAGRFELEVEIGRGGMGRVYRAQDLKLRRTVAIKIMSSHLASDPSAVKRFVREMTATTMLEHENTIRVYDYGQTDDGELYMVMEHLVGETLARAILDGSPMPVPRIKKIGAQVARALVAAHAHGIVHKDLKPGNIMLRQRYGEADQTTVLDFGIADLEGEARLTSTGLVAASAPYCPPEQAVGESGTPQSDLYMLGVVLYECATGQLPFAAKNSMGYLYAHVHEPVKPPRTLRPELPRWLDDLIVALLAKDPAQRPRGADDVLKVLSQTDVPTNQIPLIAAAVSEPGMDPVDTNHATEMTASTRSRKRRWLVGLAAVAALAGAGVGLTLIGSGARDESRVAGEALRSPGEPQRTAGAKADLAGTVAPSPAESGVGEPGAHPGQGADSGRDKATRIAAVPEVEAGTRPQVEADTRPSDEVDPRREVAADTHAEVEAGTRSEVEADTQLSDEVDAGPGVDAARGANADDAKTAQVAPAPRKRVTMRVVSVPLGADVYRGAVFLGKTPIEKVTFEEGSLVELTFVKANYKKTVRRQRWGVGSLWLTRLDEYFAPP